MATNARRTCHHRGRSMEAAQGAGSIATRMVQGDVHLLLQELFQDAIEALAHYPRPNQQILLRVQFPQESQALACHDARRHERSLPGLEITTLRSSAHTRT